MDILGNGNDAQKESKNENNINCHAPNMPADWQINGSNLANSTSPGMIGMGNLATEPSSCTAAFMVDSFGSQIWDQPMSEHGLGYCDVNVQNEASTSSGLGPVRAGINWTQNGVLGGGMFLPAVPGVIPPTIPHFPTDSAFIERAARYSCFSGGNFGEMISPFSISDPLYPYTRGSGFMQSSNEVSVGDIGLKSFSGMQLQRHQVDMTEVSNEAMISSGHGTKGSTLNNEKNVESFRLSNDETKHGTDVSGDESDEAEFSGRGDELNDAADNSVCPSLDSKKRKRPRQDTKHNEKAGALMPSIETANDNVEIRLKGDQNPPLVHKPSNKHGKPGSQESDLPKEEYIHVRARRGQATNSHSLAERVRREKISERMKFLQDLVPGCSKVTGKAVMLDEIINYVQSLQRQVEFLSMKLATVNPRLDFNMEGFLNKDILQPRVGLSSSLAFAQDVTIPFPPLHPSQPGLIQANLPSLGTTSETLRRPMNLQLGPGTQVSGVWDDGFHNITPLGFGTNAPPNSQDMCGVLPPGHLKAER